MLFYVSPICYADALNSTCWRGGKHNWWPRNTTFIKTGLRHHPEPSLWACWRYQTGQYQAGWVVAASLKLSSSHTAPPDLPQQQPLPPPAKDALLSTKRFNRVMQDILLHVSSIAILHNSLANTIPVWMAFCRDRMLAVYLRPTCQCKHGLLQLCFSTCAPGS